jgi:NAD(P)-dependent dehydrogenase (short-subunit alcohol dehydrogenase family)
MVVVITGATSGVGRTAATTFAREGACLVLAGRDERAVAEVERACRAEGAEAIGVPTDVGVEEQVEALAQAAIERFGRFDTWVNNAAVMAYGEFSEIPSEVFDRVIRTNLLGTSYGSRAALAHFRERGTGVLINVSSLWGRITSPLVGPYVASKHAVRALSEVIHAELADEPGIEVATILPSATDTPIFDNSGNFTGRRLRPVWPISSARYVADGIVACAQNPKREVTYGRLGRLLEVLYAVVPPLYRRVAPGLFIGGTVKDEPEEPSSGNVLEPAGVHKPTGGWRESRRGELARAFFGAAWGGILGLFGRASRLEP